MRSYPVYITKTKLIQPNFAFDDHTAFYTQAEKPIAKMTMEEQFANATKPYIFIKEGCHPYPAVRFPYFLSDGLKATGSRSADCSDKGGQIYSRQAYLDPERNTTLAVGTAVFFPKRAFHHSSSLYKGNRWEWQFFVEYLQLDQNNHATLLSVAVSSDWDAQKKAPIFKKYLANAEFINRFTDHQGRPFIKMDYSKHAKTANLALTTKIGDTYPYRFWDDLSESEQNALESFDFRSRWCPIAGDRFDQNIRTAWAQKPEEKLPKD
ncbi:hypothetical protein ACQY0O_005522 [Thecaphora frezii]